MRIADSLGLTAGYVARRFLRQIPRLNIEHKPRASSQLTAYSRMCV